jgi:hypothetical protein
MVWRSVELQSRVATMRLVDSLDEQARLEELLEGVKPPLRSGTDGLHFLLATPFRYKPHDRWGSRFSRPRSQGVFYAAEERRTALAETTFYRLLFLAGPEVPRLPDGKITYTLFSVSVATDRALDLTAPPLVADRPAWTHRTDLSRTQALGDAAQDIDTDIIRYESVRDPLQGAALAVLRPCFQGGILREETWHLSLLASEAALLRDDGAERLGFAYDGFLDDPRLKPLRRLFMSPM